MQINAKNWPVSCANKIRTCKCIKNLKYIWKQYFFRLLVTLEMYCRWILVSRRSLQKTLGKLASNFSNYQILFQASEYWDKNLLTTYLNFYADRYLAYQLLETDCILHSIDVSTFAIGISYLQRKWVSFFSIYRSKSCKNSILMTMQQKKLHTISVWTQSYVLFEKLF